MGAAVPIDLDALRKYDTPTICNVVELYDLYPRTAGYMDGRVARLTEEAFQEQLKATKEKK